MYFSKRRPCVWLLRFCLPKKKLLPPCGSRSQSRTLRPLLARKQARFTDVVVFPTPPLILYTAIFFRGYRDLFSGVEANDKWGWLLINHLLLFHIAGRLVIIISKKTFGHRNGTVARCVVLHVLGKIPLSLCTLYFFVLPPAGRQGL